MVASRIESRAVFKVAAIVLVTLGVALLLQHALVEIRTTVRWLFAAIFFALALSPVVDLVERVRVRGRSIPHWLAILVAYVLFLAVVIVLILEVIPPMLREFEQLGSQLPTYVTDFEQWASGSDAFRELNEKYDLTKLLSSEAAALPSKLGDAAGELKAITVGLLGNVFEAVIVLTLSYFFLLDGGQQFHRLTGRLHPGNRDKTRRIGTRIARIVRAYVTTNLLLGIAAGLFTWVVLELLGVPLAVPLAVLVTILELVPLVGFTIGGVLVAIIVGIHDFPTGLIVWGVLFLVYQQLQDRLIQPLVMKRAVNIHPAAAIVAVIAGAQLAGILGALLAIPVAAALAAIYDELWPAAVDAFGEESAGGEPSGSAGAAPMPTG